MGGTLRLQFIETEAVNQSRFESSAAADSRSRSREAAYLMEVRVVFVCRRLAMTSAPFTPSSLRVKLRTRDERCQRLLTLEIRETPQLTSVT